MMAIEPPMWIATLMLAAAVIGAIVGIAAGVRKLYRGIAEGVRYQAAAAAIIHEQLRENGGSTLLDKVNRIPAIERSIEHIEKRIEKVEAATATPREIP